MKIGYWLRCAAAEPPPSSGHEQTHQSGSVEVDRRRRRRRCCGGPTFFRLVADAARSRRSTTGHLALLDSNRCRHPRAVVRPWGRFLTLRQEVAPRRSAFGVVTGVFYQHLVAVSELVAAL